MSNDTLFALWFFLPAGIANMTPIIVAKAPYLRNLNAPIDGGKQFRGKRILGDHKTWRGLISGIVAGILVIALQALLYRHSAWLRSISSPVDYTQGSILTLGFLLSFGALIGDSIESFAKRQFRIAAGRTWFPFDQLDYIIGALICASLYIQLPARSIAWVVIIWFGMHMAFSYFGFLLKLKERPI